MTQEFVNQVPKISRPISDHLQSSPDKFGYVWIKRRVCRVRWRPLQLGAAEQRTSALQPLQRHAQRPRVARVSTWFTQLTLSSGRSLAFAHSGFAELYLYVPASSNHPASAFKSLQIGGLIRCERRNRLASDCSASVRSFRRRLKDRGFDLAGFDRLVERFSNQT